MLHYLLKHKTLLVLIILFAFLSSITTILGPVYIGNIIDSFSTQNNISYMILFLLFIYIVNFLSSIFLGKCISKISTTISFNFRKELFSKIQSIPISTIDKYSYGDTINHITIDCENITTGILQGFSKIITGILTIIIAIVIMLNINPIMACILILISPLMYIVSKNIAKNTSKYFTLRAKQIANLNSYTQEIINGIKTVQNFSYEEKSIKKFKEYNQNLYNSGIKAQFYSSLTNPITRLISNICYILTGTIGSILVIYDKLSIGNISTFLLYTTIFTRPFNEITSIISELQTALSSFKRIEKFLNLKNEDIAIPTTSIKKFSGNIDFEKVYFSYSKDTKLIKDCNFSVQSGERITIVGKTGAGKTTLINLLMRFYEIDSGKILIDGIDIKNIPKNILRKNIGIVLQDTALFEGTIFENIAYGKPEATIEEVTNASKLSHAHEFIKRLPDGYNTIISNENNLSKGEIQLINIARLILLSPTILILDEWASNLDLLTEEQIQDAFLTLMKNSTSFVIAHRLSTIQNSDKILVVENGNIVEQGTHTELINKNGIYAKLYEKT